MKSRVYYADTRAESGSESLVEKLYQLFQKAGFDEIIEENDFTAIKQHFGEAGNTAHIRPVFTRRLVEAIREAGGKPFLTDANTLYERQRFNSIDHLNTAYSHGFTPATVKAPIIIADGLTGRSSREVEVNLETFDRVKLGEEICQADSIISLAHFKGHDLTAFGGTFKNIGMGLGSRSGKQMMHSTVEPSIDVEECVKCRECVKYCPEDCIVINKDESYIIEEDCIGCGECVISCNYDAISIVWEASSIGVQERTVEFTYGVLKALDEKAGHINFITDVTPDCDCPSWSDQPIIPDQGIIAGQDPVAVEQASLDMVNQAEVLPNSELGEYQGEAAGKNKFELLYPESDGGERLIEYAEELGMGSRDYELEEI